MEKVGTSNLDTGEGQIAENFDLYFLLNKGGEIK